MQITIDERRIRFKVPYEDRHLARDIPGARWDNFAKAWAAPATPETWRAIKEAFPTNGENAGMPLEMALKWRAAAEAHKIGHSSHQVGQGAHAPAPSDYVYATRPWRHQPAATRYVLGMDRCALDCRMGAGKSKIVIDACQTLEYRRVLVLCPKHVLAVWEDQLRLHALPGRYQYLPLDRGTIAKRAQLLQNMLRIDHPRFVAINYEAAWREPLTDVLLGQKWDCIILDESHRIKGPNAKCSRFCAKLRAEKIIAMTGTLLPHSPLDIFGQYRTLDSGIFGTSFFRFRERYARMGGYGNHEIREFINQDDLRERINRLRFYLPAEELDMPDIQFINRFCELGAAAAKIYRDLENHFIAEIGEGVVTAANALAKLVRIQQATSGFARLAEISEDENAVVEIDNSKRELLQELLEDLAGERVVVYARFRHDLETVAIVARHLGLTHGEISGRANDYRTWQAGNINVLAVQWQSGIGIDLTAARYGIAFSLDFSLGNYNQSIARLHRPTQKRAVVIYHLLAKGTVDERILAALRKRERVIDAILTSYQGR